MDSLITAAARALAAGDPVGALKRVALRDDAPALALRGIAMAQLGDMAKAKILLRRASRAFGPAEPIARAKCIVAEAEVAFASRDLGWPVKTLEAARVTLEKHGDRVNAAHARYLDIRRLVLLGNLDEAERVLGAMNPENFPPTLRAAHELMVAGIAMRRVRATAARGALVLALRAARNANIPALQAEVESALVSLNTPVARMLANGTERPLLLDDIEAVFASRALIVDALRNVARQGRNLVALARRPILFAIARLLAEAWPHDVARDVLVSRVFRLKLADESHRARLRVEVGRLRAMLRPLASVNATKLGFVLVPHRARQVIVLARSVEEEHAAVLAFLADGEAWSSSALALALSRSQRSVQRALDSLAEQRKVQSIGHGRARRWMTPPAPGFATTLLLPAPLPID